MIYHVTGHFGVVTIHVIYHVITRDVHVIYHVTDHLAQFPLFSAVNFFDQLRKTSLSNRPERRLRKLSISGREMFYVDGSSGKPQQQT